MESQADHRAAADGERRHHITKCGKTENAVMAVDMLRRTSTANDSPVCSEAEVEAYTTLKIKTGGFLVSMVEEGEIMHMGDDLWFLGAEATDRFTYDPLSLQNYAE